MRRLTTNATTMLLLLANILNPASQVTAFHHASIRLQQPASYSRISTRTSTATTKEVTTSRSAVTHSRLPEIVFSTKNPLRDLSTFLRSKKKRILLAATLLLSARGLFSIFATAASPAQILKQTFQKFLLEWKMYCMIPFVAAFVGWITNYLAVQMIFYPIQWRGIPLKRVEGNPLGLLGWQGIIPAKTAKMSDAMVNVTINELLSMEETIQKLDPTIVADILAPQVPAMVQHILDDEATSASLSPALRSAASDLLHSNTTMINQRLLQDWLGKDFLKSLTKDMQHDILNLFNVRNCVVHQMMSDRSLLGKLFQMTGGKELKFLVDSGLWFGFLLGILQMLVALFCDNPWTLSMGGLIVGLLTNWIALKWIFEPIEPTKFGPFVLQGKFLRRQKEVAKDFSKFFASRILNSKEVWKSILNDPTTSPNFRNLFSMNLRNVSKRATRGLLGNKPKEVAYLNAAGTTMTKRLPYHFSQTSFHSYVDETLGIERTLRTGLESMTSRKFEQILHPIFQEDELTLILAGGFLGFLAGFGQQLLATGVWSLPSLGMVFSFLRQISPF